MNIYLILRGDLESSEFSESMTSESKLIVQQFNEVKQRSFQSFIHNFYWNQLTLKCTTPTPIVLNASPDVTTP